MAVGRKSRYTTVVPGADDSTVGMRLASPGDYGICRQKCHFESRCFILLPFSFDGPQWFPDSLVNNGLIHVSVVACENSG